MYSSTRDGVLDAAALGLADPRGQLMVSLASDAKSLALALQSNLTVLVFGIASKTLVTCFKSSLFSSYERRNTTEGPKVASQIPLPITVKNYLGFVCQQSSGLSDPWKVVQQEAQFTVLHSLIEKIFSAPEHV